MPRQFQGGINSRQRATNEENAFATVLLTKEEILAQRALAAAKKPDAAYDEDALEVVEFVLGSDTFAFEMDHLREVCSLFYVTHIPTSAPYVLGVVNLRGQIVPIIDLREFMNLARAEFNVFYKAIILQDKDLIVGFLADEVPGAKLVRRSDLQEVLPNAIANEFIKAITNERMIILDSRRLMNDKRLKGGAESRG